MSINNEVKEFIDNAGVSYETLEHPRVFSSIEEARALGMEADEIVKTLVITVRGELALAMVPGGQKIQNHKIREIFGSKHARLATEEELQRDFPQFELGAVPPLPQLLGLRGYADRELLNHDTIIFCGGTHTDSVRMNCADFINMVQPEIVDLCREEPMAASG